MVLLTFESKQNPFEINFANNPIKLNNKNEIALTGGSLWYSWQNISSDFLNNKLKYFDGTNWIELTIPDGIYDETELNNYLEEYFQKYDDCPIVFDVNSATNRFMIIINDSTYKVDLSVGKLYALLGFNPKIYDERVNYGSRIANITNDIDRILIHCSVVSGSYKNNQKSDIIYTFSPNISPGGMINIEPFQPKYLPLERTDSIFNMKISLTDQLNNIINFNGENITLEFFIK